MPTILCIDDETAALAVRKRVLESAGYHVVAARSSEEGIRLFQSENLDLVLLDYWMSGANGMTTARELKRINPLIPMIILSGLSQLPGETIGVVDRWIMKDEGPEYLLSAVSALLKSVTPSLQSAKSREAIGKNAEGKIGVSDGV